MSHTYRLQATNIYGGRDDAYNMYFSTLHSTDTLRIGYYQLYSKNWQSAVSIFFDADELAAMRLKTIEKIELTVQCTGTFAYRHTIAYNVKATDDVEDWTIPNYDYTLRCEKHATVPVLDMTSIGLPQTNAYVVGSVYRGYAYVTVVGAYLDVTTADEPRTITYDANGGTGTPEPTIIFGSESWTGSVTSSTPARSGYTFANWNTARDGSGDSYGAGSQITITNNITLYAQWNALSSILDDVDATEIGSAVHITWTNKGAFVNKLRFVFGSADSGVISVYGTSAVYTLPYSWNSELPNATSGLATVYLYTYDQWTLIGTTSKQFTVSVPASIVPTVGVISAVPINDNPIVEAQSIYLQQFSKVRITVSGSSAGDGATILSYHFLGQNMNKTIGTSGATVSATSEVIELGGSLAYTVKITDSRGRATTRSISISVVSYHLPAVTYLQAGRCNSDGSDNPVTGRSLKAKASFAWANITGNTLTTSLSYKRHVDAAYTEVYSGLVEDQTYVFAVDTAAVDSSYDIMIQLSESLGGSATFVAIIPPIIGIGFGLKNDRARFGGPTEEAGLVCDWDFKLNGNMIVRDGAESVTLSFEDFQALKALIGG